MTTVRVPQSRLPRRRFFAKTAGGLAGVGAMIASLDALFGQENGTAAGRKVKIAAIALATVDGMLENNYARGLRMAEISLRDKPDIILLPEAFAAGYGEQALADYGEEVAKSKHLAKFRRLSATAHCMIVLGYLEKVEGDRRLRNATAIYDGGQLLGRHYKHNLWPDSQRPYRDEPSMMVAGKEIEIFHTRLGRFAVLICYENSFATNWDSLRGKVDFVLSPYNCEGDSSRHNVSNAKRLGIPSAWADRTGTVYRGNGGYTVNRGTAGLVGANGKTIVHSQAGIERIVVGELEIRKPSP
jgi:predicted amidohydrolase